jgi:hypothetical protein
MSRVIVAAARLIASRITLSPLVRKRQEDNAGQNVASRARRARHSPIIILLIPMAMIR